jgi:hypothetical protein
MRRELLSSGIDKVSDMSIILSLQEKQATFVVDQIIMQQSTNKKYFHISVIM